MAKVKYEVTAITGKYKDASGAEKNRYTRMGVVIQTDKGFSLKLEAIPVGWDGWAMLQEPRSKDAPKPETKTTGGGFDNMKDDLLW